MTNRELYLRAKALLVAAGCESPAFDACCLCEKHLGLDRAGLAVHGAESAAPAAVQALLQAARARAQGQPLQYLLGRWPFLDLLLEVGPGVLSPREETELLAKAAAQRLPQAARVLDLCAGSGAVGLGVASLRPDAHVCCGEKFGAAYRCLCRNCAGYPQLGVRALRMDLFSAAQAAAFPIIDALLCNPPYVRTRQIPQLQRELQFEPREALDGGADGLAFYRALARLWLPRLRPGGLCAVEIGEEQGRAVAGLLRAAGCKDLQILRDFNGWDRVVLAYRGG